MITIVKGNNRIVCSYKTYEDQFKQLGYLPVTEEKTETKKVVEVEKEEKAEENITENIEEEKSEKVEESNEEEKIGSKYGVRRRTTSKKEGE